MSALGYTEQHSLNNDTMNTAENIGLITTSSITIYGSCSVRYSTQDDDFYSFTPAGNVLRYNVPIKGTSSLNKLFIAVLDSSGSVIAVLCGELTSVTQSGSLTVTPNRKYYLHCTRQYNGVEVPYQVTLSSNGSGGGGGGGGGGGTSTKPDLSPYTPSGWASSMVLSTYSSSRGSTYTSFKDTDNIYLSWAFTCSGASISSTFYTYLYVDGVKKYSWKSDGLSSGYYANATGHSLGKLSAGSHTIKLVTDATGAVSESSESNNTISRSITVNATAKKHVMTLYRNNSSGDGAGARRTVTEGSYYTLPTIASLGWTRSDYTFKGWATYRGATTATYGDGERIYVGSSLYSLYAVWQSNVSKHVLTLYRNNSSGDGAGVRRTVIDGKFFTLPTIASLGWTRSDYTFKGWATYRGATTATYGDGERIYVGSSLYSLYAVWQSNVSKHVLTLYRNNSYGDGAGARRTVTDGKFFTLPTIASLGWTRSDYTFKGWATYRGATTATYGDGERIYVGSSLYSLYAVWESTATKYVVRLHRNYSAGDGATAGRTMVVGSYRALPSVYSLDWDRDGYTFEGWAYYPDATVSDVIYVDGESVSNLSYFSGDEVHLYAVWRPRATGAKTFDGMW